jgi:intracellular multiplication protein IcmL
MTTERPASNNDAFVMIVFRQMFYLQQLRLVLGAFLLQLLLITSLIGMLVYFVKHPTHPIYFATDKIGRLMVEPALSQPNMPSDAISDWAVRAVEAAYSYNFVNYRQELQNAEGYFTDYGWKQYMKGLDASNNLLALIEHKMIVRAKVVAKPRILVQGILGGRYAWKFEMPVLVTYLQPPYDDKAKFSNPLMVTVTITRQKYAENEHGLGIVQIIANLAIGNPTQNVNTPGT